MISFKSFLLLEHDIEKTWSNYGSKLLPRIKEEKPQHFRNVPEDQHHEVAKKILDDHINQGDPTPNKSYGRWIAQSYASGDKSGARGIARLEDIPGRVNSALQKFHTKKHALKRVGVDSNIFNHKSLSDLETALDKLPEDAKSKKQEKKDVSDEMHSQAHHYEDEHWHYQLPQTQEASCHYGKGTKWCTAGKDHNMFHSYFRKDDPGSQLIIATPKVPKYAGEKYQLHINSGQYMNEKDRDIHPKKVFGSDRPASWLTGYVKQHL